KVVNEFDGILPADVEILNSLPQIGHNTINILTPLNLTYSSSFHEIKGFR
ncbi:unnamed protein product, partial [marine sediment metagenome]